MSKKLKTRLTGSVLLEEQGFPFLYGTIAVTVFLIICSFLVWSYYLKIDQTVMIESPIKLEQDLQTFEVVLPPSVALVAESGQLLVFTIPELNSNTKLTATVVEVNSSKKNEASKYTAKLKLVDNAATQKVTSFIEDDMNLDGKLIIGKKSLLEQMIGPVLVK